MALMEACMVPLPFAAASGKTSVLHTLVESSVPVQTYGSDTVKAIVDYKWRNFAQRRVYIKALVYLNYTLIFTVFAALFADVPSDVRLVSGGVWFVGKSMVGIVWTGVVCLNSHIFHWSASALFN